ncbi:DUF4276 family protein [Zoogloea sp.]|uniref:DUF4276 family protein n=1 Tax=Zoogloea sp. TaxID=49181 RepID=UPI0025E3818B|nr:DUF4276 family protein [Zoogloea sp.]MCK6395175.1 DUF4276 family protein [Zoogloea sp.]
MSAHLYIEGGESKEDQIRCREGFRKLIGKLGFAAGKKMPRLTACGGRNSALDDFKTAHSHSKKGDYIAMLIDSEDPVADGEKTWEHLKARDNWHRPAGADDEQVLLMTTCMETWIVADRTALKAHYGHKLQENALPPLIDLEKRNRKEVHDKLTQATRDCSNAYAKGKRSFEVVGTLTPAALSSLAAFARLERILKAKL